MNAPADHEYLAQLKLPPFSIEAEQSVLGALMLNNDSWDRIGELVSTESFFRADHRLIYDAISNLIEHNKPADSLTVSEHLKNKGRLEEAGGFKYVGSLAESSPGATNIRQYAEIIYERAVLRKLVVVGNDIADSAYTPDGRTASDILSGAETSVLQIAQSVTRQRGTFTTISEALSDVMTHLDERSKSPNALSGIATGFVDIDVRLDGLQRGDLIIVAGRPSMGKTAFALNVVEHIVIQVGMPVLVFSMEMGTTQLATRALASQAKVDSQALRHGRLEPRDWDRLNGALVKLNDAPLQIDDTGNLSHSEIRARARRMHRKYGGLGAIVVDYLQLMRATGKENRATEIGDMSSALKAMAKELNCPVVALSQLNRGLEQRPNKRPVMSDLRESGAIEQDADVIMALYRDEVYNPDSPNKGMCEVITLKQRNGPIGTDMLTFIGRFTRFENYAGDYQPGYVPAQPRSRKQFGD